MSEPDFSARVVWEGNDAIIECYLWDEAQGDFEGDLLELSIKPGEGLGEPHNLFMDLTDAWALVSVIAQCALKQQIKVVNEYETLEKATGLLSLKYAKQICAYVAGPTVAGKLTSMYKAIRGYVDTLEGESGN